MEIQEKRTVLKMPGYVVTRNVLGQTIIKIFDDTGYIKEEWLFEPDQHYGVVWAKSDELKLKIIWCSIAESYRTAVKIFNRQGRLLGKWRFAEAMTAVE